MNNWTDSVLIRFVLIVNALSVEMNEKKSSWENKKRKRERANQNEICGIPVDSLHLNKN